MFRWLILAALAMQSTSANAQAISFADVTEPAGLVKPLVGIMGHGGAWGDFEGDGRIDLYIGGFCDRPDAEYKPGNHPVANLLLRNLGEGRFERSVMPAVETFGRTSGAVFADLDDDGDLDLYVANNAKALAVGDERSSNESLQMAAEHLPNRLYRNDGGRFIDVSTDSGACPAHLHTARNVGVLDYDGDGRLDLYVVEDRFTDQPRSALYKNVGELKFKDVTRDTGLPEDVYGLGLAIADLNDDSRPDIFVGHSNRFFISTPGGKFAEPPTLRETFAWQPLDGEDWPCGAAFGDLNRDGLLDLVIGVHGVRARNRVYLNAGVREGVPRFRDATTAVGFPEEVPTRCPHVEIQDFDNDGWPDIYFSAAWLDADGRVTPLVFRNGGIAADGELRFVPPRKIGGPMLYYPAGPTGDFDGDGRLDLILVNWFTGNHSRLMHNVSVGDNHWLQIQVVGRTVNRKGIGSTVRIYRAGQAGDSKALLGMQEIASGYGYASGQPAIAHFGLGRESSADVEVTLPSGKVILQTGVEPDQRLVVTEPR